MPADEGLDFAADFMGLALRQGAEDAEVFSQWDRARKIQFQDRTVDTVDLSESIGFALRVVAGGKSGFVYLSTRETSAARDAVGEAMASARWGDETAVGFAVPTGDPGAVEGTVDRSSFSRDDAELTRFLEGQIAEAFAVSERVKRIRKATLVESRQVVNLVSSRGFRGRKEGTHYSLGGSIVAALEDEQEIASESAQGRLFDDLAGRQPLVEAARRADAMLGARSLPTGRYPVILAPSVACGFLAVFAGALSGEAVVKGKSPLAGKVGQSIGSASFTLRDDGLMPGGWGSEPFDDEGIVHRRADVVSRGTLQGYLLNLRSSARLGIPPTGNGWRSDYKSLPAVHPANLHLVSDDRSRSPEELVSMVPRGIMIRDAMGFHTLDPVSGNISLGASGFVIEGGRLGRPFRGVTIGGNLYELIRRIAGSGTDLRFYGGVGSPSLLIEYLDVAGQE